MNLPFVRINMAVTADGKIATADRSVSSFGSAHDLRHLYALRRRADAILCGATTVNAEGADLGPGPAGLRPLGYAGLSPKLPLRVIASGRGGVRSRARLFRQPFGPILILATRRITASRLHRLRRVAHTVRLCGRDTIDFSAALQWLYEKWNVRDLLCEGGSRVNAALLHADLVDEIHLTLCPLIVGGAHAPTIADGPGVAQLADASTWRLQRVRRLKNELFLTYQRLRRT